MAQVQKIWCDSIGIFVGPVILTIDQQFLSEVRREMSEQLYQSPPPT